MKPTVHFQKKVSLRSRKAMTEFLSKHFRYSTMNSWNGSSSYAHCVKIHRLPFSEQERNVLYDMLDTEEAYEPINNILREFDAEHDFEYQVGFNGRSGGYLVLYRGGKKLSEHKSFCIKCGQFNFTKVEEGIPHPQYPEIILGKCGRCGQMGRRNFDKPHYDTYTMPGQSIGSDDADHYADMSMYELREEVKLVQEFDRLCDEVIDECKYIAATFEVAEEEIQVPKTIKVLRERVA